MIRASFTAVLAPAGVLDRAGLKVNDPFKRAEQGN